MQQNLRDNNMNSRMEEEIFSLYFQPTVCRTVECLDRQLNIPCQTSRFLRINVALTGDPHQVTFVNNL